MQINMAAPAQQPRHQPRFGQLFVGEAGKVIVLEPKDTYNKGIVLHQAVPNGPINPLTTSPVVAEWTKVVENYGPLFNKGAEGFYALANLFRHSLGQSGVINTVPLQDKQNAMATLLYGKAAPFNGGLKLDYPA